jgi:class 3 adenylate cyclase
MKIRYRLFLVLGALFVICYLIAIAIQAYVTNSSIKKAQKGVVQQLEEMHREKRMRIEDFLSSIIAERFSQIETLLMSVSSYPPQAEVFLDGENSWQNLGGLLYSNKWLDFLRQSNAGFTDTSLFIDKRYLKKANLTAQAQDDPSIIKIESEGKEWVGIVLPFELLSSEAGSGKKEPIMPFLLFTQEQIQTLANVSLPLENTKEWAPIVQKIEGLIAKASKMNSWEAVTPTAITIPDTNQEVQLFDRHLQEWIERSDQVIMTRLLAELAGLQLFGKDPSEKDFPKGMVSFSGQSTLGSLLISEDALFQGVELDKVPIPLLSKEFPFVPSVYMICDESLILGSSLSLQSGNKNGELTIGICLREIAQDLSSEFDMPFFCVLNGKIFLQGTKWDNLLQEFPLERIASKDSGVIDIDDNAVFFMRMKPLPGIDLEFVAVNYAKIEFAFLDYFETGAKQVLSEISKRMWMVAVSAMILALLFLNRLAKRITEPVSKLAAAASAVSKGKLQEVTLPKIRIDRKDEIHTLYSSFDDMVQSLKDKEKVRAALNKVVSPVIASEILKSEMELGGERKKVCIWFADIRGFTKITETMKPEQVIVMLNHCMTRVSHIIDENKGVIDKYVGDEVMALFGIPNANSDDALRAIQSAIEVQQLLKRWNQERQAEGKPAVQMGIGIDIGDVLAGNMGATDRQNYTVLGRHVNIASRLCSIAAPGQVLITESMVSSPGVRDRYLINEVGKESLKGFTEPIVVYEVKLK